MPTAYCWHCVWKLEKGEAALARSCSRNGKTPLGNYCFDTKHSVFHDCYLFEATKQTIACAPPNETVSFNGLHMLPFWWNVRFHLSQTHSCRGVCVHATHVWNDPAAKRWMRIFKTEKCQQFSFPTLMTLIDSLLRTGSVLAELTKLCFVCISTQILIYFGYMYAQFSVTQLKFLRIDLEITIIF